MMSKRKKAVGIIAAVLCYSAALAGIFYFVGYRAASGSGDDLLPPHTAQTFYATISEIRENHLTVVGMEENSINFRGTYWLSATEDTAITWRGMELSVSDLEVGDHISVTFSGFVLESNPGRVQGVDVIELLDDEL